MKKILAVASAVALGSALAADTFVGAYQFATNHVEAGGTAVQSDRLTVAPGAKLLKTGEGQLVIREGAMAQKNPVSVTVAEGELRFAPGSGPAAAAPAVLADAALWLKADDVDAHFEKEGDAVSAWYDARETDVSARRYLCAKGRDNTDAATTVTLTTKDGFASLYFGGLGSGKAMKFFLPGASDASKIKTYHLFAVVGYYQSQGCLFGSGSNVGSWFMFNPAQGIGLSYADPQYIWPEVYRNNTYVDGERFDPYGDVTPSGRFHLFDHGGQCGGSTTGALFGQWSSKTYWGGDYLSEAIAFTNTLTEAQRLQVEDYLMRKWFPTAKRVKQVALDSDGKYVLDATDDAVDSRDVTLKGNGTLVKRGTNAAFFRSSAALPTKDDLFRGTVQLENGALELSSQAALEVAAGETVSAVKTDAGNRAIAKAATAGVGKLSKSGDESVTIAAVPTDAKEINVTAGQLAVRPAAPTKTASKVSYLVPIENPSFEDYLTEEQWLDPGVAGATGMPSTVVGVYTKGWRRQTNAARLFNWRLWTGTSPVMDKNTRVAWNMDHRPVDGDCAVMLFRNGILATPITITEPGTYELSYDLYARESANSYGFYGYGEIWDTAADKAVTVFGRSYYYDHQYRRVAFKARVEKTGSFELRFRAQNENDSLPVVVDNFQLRFVPERELETGVVEIPNGDFEYDPTPGVLGGANRRTVTESPFDNWTFDQGQGFVGVTTLAQTNHQGYTGCEANALGAPSDSFRQLIMKYGACSATVTFTPPAGEYFLRADIGRYYQYRGQLSATLSVAGGAPVALGSIVVTNHLMKAYTWPTPFVADGASEMSITFAFARSQATSQSLTGVYLDNVALVTSNDRELLGNGGFETPYGSAIPNWAAGWARYSSETVVVDDVTYVSYSQVQPYSYLPHLFCGDKIEGSYFMYLERLGGASRDVTFPQAGLYRFSFQAATSQRTYQQGWYKGPNGLRAWIAKDGVTNEIGRTGFVTTTNYCQHVWEFRVPAAGTYSFGFRGTEQTVGGGNVCVDALSIRPVAAAEHGDLTAPVFASDAKVAVAAGANLRVEFDGTNALKRLTVGGQSLRGLIDVRDYPQYFSGRGVFNVPAPGALLLLK